MNRYFGAGLVVLYILLTVVGFLIGLRLVGVSVSDRVFWICFPGWMGFCFGAGWWYPEVLLFFRDPVRRPTRGEEVKLGAAWKIVEERLEKIVGGKGDGARSKGDGAQVAARRRPVKLRVKESPDWQAFATGTQTIVVSKRMVADLTEEELCGVLAHELGHLICYDTVVGVAYFIAGRLPQASGLVFRWSVRGLMTGARIGWFFGWWVLLVMGFLLYFFHVLWLLLVVALLVGLFAVLDRVFYFLFLVVMRMAEYRQDAFAWRLGFGKELRDVLEKLAQQGEQPVNGAFILFRSTHPVIYNRLRRLEDLEGRGESIAGQ